MQAAAEHAGLPPAVRVTGPLTPKLQLWSIRFCRACWAASCSKGYRTTDPQAAALEHQVLQSMLGCLLQQGVTAPLTPKLQLWSIGFCSAWCYWVRLQEAAQQDTFVWCRVCRIKHGVLLQQDHQKVLEMFRCGPGLSWLYRSVQVWLLQMCVCSQWHGLANCCGIATCLNSVQALGCQQHKEKPARYWLATVPEQCRLYAVSHTIIYAQTSGPTSHAPTSKVMMSLRSQVAQCCRFS